MDLSASSEAVAVLSNMATQCSHLHDSVIQSATQQSQRTTTMLHTAYQDKHNLLTQHTDTLTQHVALARDYAKVRLERDVMHADLAVANHSLQVSLSTAAQSVASKLQTLDRTSLAVVVESANKDSLQRQNAALAEALSSLHTQALVDVKHVTQRSEQIIGDLTASHIKVSQLTSQNEWLGRRLQDCQSEVVTLLSALEEVGNRVRDQREVEDQLTIAQTHVKLLERQLSVEGIVQAVLSKESLVSAAAELAQASAPDPALKLVAPDFYTLRSLEHRGLALTEVVDQWDQQRERIVQLAKELSVKQGELEKLQADAGRVYFLYSDERRRRTAAETRSSELERRRVGSQSEEAQRLLDNLCQTKLELSSTKDTNALLTVQLQDVRQDSLKWSAKNAELLLKMEELERQLRADTVAQSLGVLKLNYERQMESQEGHFRKAVQERELAVSALQQCQYLFQDEAKRGDQLQESNKALLETVQAQVEQLESLQAQLDALQETSWDSAVERISTAKHHLTLHNNDGKAKSDILSIRNRTNETVTRMQQVAQGVAALRTQLNEKSSLLTKQEETSHDVEQATFRAQMNDTFQKVLNFVQQQAESSNTLRGYFLEMSAAEANCLLLLQKRLEETDKANSQLTERLKACEELIERHSLTAVEGVLAANGTAELLESAASPTTVVGGGSFPIATASEQQHVSEEHQLLLAQAKELILQRDSLHQELEAKDQLCMKLSTELAIVTAKAERLDRTAIHRQSLLQVHNEALAAVAAELQMARGGLLRAVVAVSETQDPQQRAEDHQQDESSAEGDNNAEDPQQHAALFARLDTLSKEIARLSSETNATTTTTLGTAEDMAAEGGEVESEGTSTSNNDGLSPIVSTIKETLHQDGLASVAAILKDIYSVSGLIRKTRAEAAGDAATAESATHTKLMDTLSTRCTVLEETVAARDTVIQQLQSTLQTKDQQGVEALAATQLKQAQLEGEHARLNGVVEKLQAELLSKQKVNEQLLTLLKRVQGGGGAAPTTAGAGAAPPSTPPLPPATPPQQS